MLLLQNTNTRQFSHLNINFSRDDRVIVSQLPTNNTDHKGITRRRGTKWFVPYHTCQPWFPPISNLHAAPSFKITTRIVRDVLVRGLFAMKSSTHWKKLEWPTVNHIKDMNCVTFSKQLYQYHSLSDLIISKDSFFIFIE